MECGSFRTLRGVVTQRREAPVVGLVECHMVVAGALDRGCFNMTLWQVAF